LSESTRSAPRYLSLGSCLALALLGAAAGLGLRLLKPVAPPDPALLARLETWKALAPELQKSHHLQAPRRPD
jgi:hypothetical protein